MSFAESLISNSNLANFRHLIYALSKQKACTVVLWQNQPVFWAITSVTKGQLSRT